MMAPAPSFARSLLLLALPRAMVLLALWVLARHARLTPAPALAVILCDGVLLVWQISRYHRRAEAHIRDTGAMAASWGGYLLWLFAALACLTLWWDLALVAQRPIDRETDASRLARARAALYLLEVTPDGRTLRFQGEITYGLTARLEELLAAAPDMRQIELTSPGGLVFEARGAAQVILAAGLSTRGVGECSSACTLLFLAGTSRSLAPQARLGFHGYGLSERVHLPGYDIAAVEARDRAYLEARGVAPEFADQAFATPPEAMWYPPRALLLSSGVLTR